MYDRLHVHLQKAGKSATPTRDRVFEAIKQLGPCRLGEVRRELQGEISRPTVYRAIKLFLATGVAEMIRQDVIRLRPPFRQDSHYMLCDQCGREIAFNYEPVERALGRAAASRDFVMTHHRVELYGQCGVCSGVR